MGSLGKLRFHYCEFCDIWDSECTRQPMDSEYVLGKNHVTFFVVFFSRKFSGISYLTNVIFDNVVFYSSERLNFVKNIPYLVRLAYF